MASLVTYTIAAALANSLSYGILTILLVVLMFLLGRQNGPPSKASRFSLYLKPVVLASILLFSVVTAHWSVTIYRLSQAFGNPTRDPMEVIGNISLRSNVAEIALAFLSTILGDCIIIYRLWMIWGCNRIVVIFPIFSAVGECVSFAGLVCQSANAGTANGAELFTSWNYWIVSACVFTLCTNIYCSGLIMWRLLVSRRKDNSGTGGDVIVRASIIAVESAALYTAWAIFFFASYEAGAGIYLFAATVWPPITGIAIMLINVRVELGRVRESNPFPASQMSVGWEFNHSNSDPSRGININVTRTMNVDRSAPISSTGEPGIGSLT
ncbi:hypothetical protein BD779DRAFT_1119662 [Infundibulicybe gibba]|nr:hypothetical protein BD779DRAFT_1119662 [Infundibulicybe gibba]